MASLPSPTKIAGKHNGIFEAYYRQIDPKALGTIPAMDAAKFLKKSALSDVVLSRIWDLSDPNGRGCLDKPGFFVALKLVSLAQCGQVINMSNIYYETQNPPKVGVLPKLIPQNIQSVQSNSNDWTMRDIDRSKYENLFASSKPVNGLLHGNSVKKVLLDSKLPMDTLGKIWDLADQDRDGSLDKHEFTVAMHLVYQALAQRAVPEVLPPELLKGAKILGGGPPPRPGAPPHAIMPKAPSGEGFGDGGFVANFPSDMGPPPVPPLPAAIPAPISRVQPPNMLPLISTEPIIPTAAAPASQQQVEWVVGPSELIRFEQIFRDCDRDKDGLVSGLEVKNVFLQSGVPQNCLAHIWALCDTNQSGKLTLEQFALAIWMVERKKVGIEPPETLTTNMVPPSLRAIVKGVEVVQQAEAKPVYQNPELEMISKEIEDLARERRVLETDIAQKEADIRIKTGEVRSLQSELDTLTATLKQLENQKGEAQKRLDDLKAQVNKIREQCQKQEETINEQEGELNTKKSELQKLKDEENSLEREYDEKRKELDQLTGQLSDTHMQISQIRTMVTQLLETQRQMTDALLLCRAVVESNDASIISDYNLQIEPDLERARQTLVKKMEQTKQEPELRKLKNESKFDAFSSSNGFDSYGGDGNTKFPTNFNDNNFASSGFDDAFGASNTGFGVTNTTNSGDPFGDTKNRSVSPVPPGKDDFGSDPFAILHAPTGQGQVLSPNMQKSGPPPRPESPSPALPPKKAKQPPPRPAPPRPVQGPTRSAPAVDSFTSSGGGFADFDDFDNKQFSFSPTPSPIIPQNQFQNTIELTNNSILENNERSITPKQNNTILSNTANDLSTTQFSTSSLASTVLSTKSGVSSSANGLLTDFSDDPFKDYRYEDVFNIKDPFADDDNEDDEISSEDPFSEDSNKQTGSFNKNKVSSKSNEFIDNFQITPVASPLTTNVHQQQMPAAAALNNNSSFADFDAFESNLNNNNTDPFEKFNNNSDFFDPFNDNAFSKNLKTNTNKNNNFDKFDPFGISTETSAFSDDKQTKSSKIFENSFSDFEDDFTKMKISNTSTNSNNFKFDAFNDFNASDNFNIMSNGSSDKNKNNNNQNAVKVTEKFASDYSKSDLDFDKDLQETLKRSMQEK